MIPSDIQALILGRLNMSQETLDDAIRMAEIGTNGRSIINRAYYAMFYAILGLSNLKQFPTRKHQASIAFFDREFVHTGIFPKEMSAGLHEAFDLRMEADYADFFQPSDEEILSVMENAKSFVGAIRTYLHEQIYEGNKS
jgi:uncharacterized protein (UPF0332 family)